jgi:hypothetical protein
VRDAANAGLTEAASALADEMTEILGGDHGGVPSQPGETPTLLRYPRDRVRIGENR